MQKGKQSIIFSNPPVIAGAASAVGSKEGEGPLRGYFDLIDNEDMFGGSSWEDAESRMQLEAAKAAIKKAGYTKKDIRCIVGGDLLGQLIATSFGIESLDIPLLGVYGACSTMGESMLVASVLIDGMFAERVLAVTSSHFASAEKQFRFPLAYGNQRPQAASWTVTGSGAVVLEAAEKSKENQQGSVRVYGGCIGKIVDYGIKDSMNMGACMAPAASDTIAAYLTDTGTKPSDYDKIITGDLGAVGSSILKEILLERGYDCSMNHADCGLLIYDCEAQGVQSGGSGCGCSAATFAGYILDKLKTGEWRRILFVPTGALLSPTSFNEGQSVPGIAHLLEIRNS